MAIMSGHQILFLFFLLVCHRVNAMDVTDFFPDVAGNLTKVTWAHAVNSQQLLNEALSGEIMMLEADVVYGILDGERRPVDQPIMGHPPATSSDISLEMFLTQILDFNTNDANANRRKGVKLDFKTVGVFVKSVPILQKLYDQMNYPVWINADIIHGPMGSAIPVEPIDFFQYAVNFTESTLSIGWTTGYDNNNIPSYSNEHVDSMLAAIEAFADKSVNYTFPVRAGIVATSLAPMHRLLAEVGAGSTLTIWSGADDQVDVQSLRQLIFAIGIDRVYVDVPADLMAQLCLDCPDSSNPEAAMGAGANSVHMAAGALLVSLASSIILFK